MPLIETKGAASAQGFGFTLGGAEPVYIEQIFSTWLYTGTGSTQTINNGIDLAGKGGLVWTKNRSQAYRNFLYDTSRKTGSTYWCLNTDRTAAQESDGNIVPLANGFQLSGGDQNVSGTNIVTWTFREQPKFFDIVTYTGTGSPRTVAHNLGSTPGCIIVKNITNVSNWVVYHRSIGATQRGVLNSTVAFGANSLMWNNTEPTSTVFTVGTGDTNTSGDQFVAYLFAHNAGGFGLTGTDNVISCGAYTGNGSTQDINLGYEAQWVLVKNATTAGWDWYTIDNMRGFVVNPASPSFTKSLSPNTSGAESDQTAISPSSTGFRLNSGAGAFNQSGQTYIYIAIRRGPMKTPTTGTSVFAINSRIGTSLDTTVTGLNATDFAIVKRTTAAVDYGWVSRLTANRYLSSNTTGADTFSSTNFPTNPWDVQNGFKVGGGGAITNEDAATYINYLLDRAPGFFDVVCYTGTGSARTVAHNLGVAPEMMIVKRRNADGDWATYTVTTGVSNYLRINETSASAATGNLLWNSTAPTSTVFSLGTDGWVNGSGSTYVAYLFASCPGVSKVGSFTGTGATQVINCGFTGGARFVLIKTTSTTGDWYVWDSTRGIVAGNDPYIRLNSSATQVTNTDWVDTAASGFELSNAGGNLANSNGVSYIFLAIS